MNRIIQNLSLFVLTLTFASAAYAIGSGAGGSETQPTCNSDTWECGNWSACDEGVQNRTCSKAYDCPSAETASPAQTQSCTPECIKDEFNCSEWSNCSAEGERTRTCSLSFDCPSASTDKPNTSEACEAPEARTVPEPVKKALEDAPVPTLYSDEDVKQEIEEEEEDPEDPAVHRVRRGMCGKLETMTERVRCRLEQESEEQEHEVLEHYAPEECLTSYEDQEEYSACILKYWSLWGCWDTYPIGHPQRFSCVKDKIGINNISEQKEACGEDEACHEILRENAFTLVKAYIYDVEEKAEQFLEAGAPLDPTIDIIVAVELGKKDFNESNSYEERLQILVEIRKSWKMYIDQIKDSI